MTYGEDLGSGMSIDLMLAALPFRRREKFPSRNVCLHRFLVRSLDRHHAATCFHCVISTMVCLRRASAMTPSSFAATGSSIQASPHFVQTNAGTSLTTTTPNSDQRQTSWCRAAFHHRTAGSAQYYRSWFYPPRSQILFEVFKVWSVRGNDVPYTVGGIGRSLGLYACGSDECLAPSFLL